MRAALLCLVAWLAACGAPSGPGAHDREFRDAVERVDRVVFVGGGGQGELADPAEVRAFLDLFRFEDVPAGGRCRCNSDIDIELLDDGETVLQIGLHEARCLRGVPWDDDPEHEVREREAPLTDNSARAVCAWFAAHGATGPASDVERAIAREESCRHSRRRSAELLPETVRAELSAVTGNVYATKSQEADVLRRFLPDGDARATLALRLYAVCGAGFHGAEETLDRLPGNQLRTVLRRAQVDPETALGADTWVVGHDRTRRLDRVTLDEFLRPAAERLLVHSSDNARMLAIVGLRDADHPDALAVLRAILDDPQAEDRRWAAEILLLDKEDVASFARVRELLPTFPEHERELLVERMDLLERPDEK